MTHPNHYQTKETTCPECGATVGYSVRIGVQRVRAKAKRCEDCGAIFR